MSAIRQTPVQLEDVFRALCRHKRKGIVFFCVVLSVTVLFALLAPRQYRSEGKLFVRLGRENATLDPTATFGQNSIVAMPYSRESEINSEVEILQSRALIEQVVDALGPEKIVGRENREKAIRRVSKLLEVVSAKKSSVISVRFRGPTPELSRAVVAKLIDVYLEEHGRINRTHGSHDFFADQTHRLHERLSQGESLLRKLKDETGLASPAAQRKLMVARIGRIEDDLLKTEELLAVEEASVDNLRRKAASLPETQVKVTDGVNDDGTNRMRERFYALQLEQKRAQSQYTDEHPKMKQLHAQIAAAKKILDQEDKTHQQVTREPGKLRQEAEMALLVAEPKLASLRSQSQQLKTQLADVRLKMNKLNADELRVAAVQREVDLLEADYRKYSTNLEQVRIDQQLEAQQMSNISVVQPASFEPRPVQPKVMLICLLGFFTAALGGLGLPLAVDYYEKSLQPPEIATLSLGRTDETQRAPILAAFAHTRSR